MSKPNVWARRKARRALVQAVYQWQVSGTAIAQLERDFAEGEALKKADKTFFAAQLGQVLRDYAALDEVYLPLLDRDIAALDLVERALLRLATAELKDRIDVPYRVVIDEYVELAKLFGAQDSHKYINGVLDRLSATLRQVEVQAAAQSQT